MDQTEDARPPLMRIFTFGGIALEQLISTPADPTPRYQRISHEVWQSRGPALTMLKFLASRPVLAARQATHEELIDAIWTENDQQKMGDVEKALRTAAGVLRKVLTPEGSSESLLLVIPGTGGESTIYKLVGQDRLWLDADHFEWLVARAIRTPDVQAVLPLWQEAKSLYRGIFLDSNRYQDWSQARRESLQADYRRLVLYLAELHLQAGDVQMADELLQPFVALHPTDEDALGLLMSVLEHQGQYHAAWQLYRRARGQERQQDQQISPRLHAIARRIREHLRTPAQPLQVREHIDWGEAPQAAPLYGRSKELEQLETWIVQEHARLVAVVGMVGVGKTSLVVKLVEQVKTQFESVLWRSLQNAPSLHTLLEQCLAFFSGEPAADVPADEAEQIKMLLSLWQQRRCLLILDGMESLFQERTYAGAYREGHAGYGMLLSQLGEARHQSCILLISRELPRDVVLLEGKHATVHISQLEGLQAEDGVHLLKGKGITGPDEVQKKMVGLYGGNPLLLILAAQYLRDVYGGASEPFVRDDVVLTDEIREILDQQFDRLSGAEQVLLSKIEKASDGMRLDALQTMSTSEHERRLFRDVLRSLQRRFLVQVSETHVALSMVIARYVSERLKHQRQVTTIVLKPDVDTTVHGLHSPLLDCSQRELKHVHTLEAGIAFMKETRRHLLQQMWSMVGTAMVTPHAFSEPTMLERLVEGVTSPLKISDMALTQLEHITRSYWHLFLHAPSKEDLLSSFWGHLQTILQFLKYPQPGATRNRLYSVAGETAQMIGEVLFDMQDYHNARIYYEFSIYAAKEAGNNVLRAVSLGRLSFLPIYKEKPEQAYPLLQEAKQLLASTPRPLIHSWLAVVEAEAVAHLQDEVTCEQALERAIVNYQQEGPEEDMLWTRLNDATIPGYQGACYLQLQQPQKALMALKETLASIPAYSPRHRSLILADMAAAMQQMNEIEEACAFLNQALEITTQTKSLMVLTRMQRVRNNLEPWKETSHVKQLDASIREILPSIIV